MERQTPSAVSLGDAPGSGGAPVNPGGHYVSGVEYLAYIATEVSGSQGATATQLFATPAQDRRAVTITNCEPAGGTDLYIGHSASVSASLYVEVLAPRSTKTFAWGPGVPVWIFGAAGNTDYYATEEVWRTE